MNWSKIICILISTPVFLSVACKKRKPGLNENQQGLVFDRLRGKWESPCYLSKENSFITYSKTVQMSFAEEKIIRTETLWLDTACKKKLLSRIFSGEYSIVDNFNKRLIHLDFSYDLIQVAIHDEAYAAIKNKENKSEWQVGEFRDTEMSFPNDTPLKGTNLFTVYYIDSTGMLHWGMPSQTVAGRPREATRETYARVVR
ncbi:MAG: hypothetical protein AB8G05_28190 [Oligoflexales bacterium]